jgi:molybdopterin/thiamine biosynthesis adenylyltransferase/rhodanese-related sulfurtransferase
VELTNDELLRYSRHLSLPEFGLEGQKRLKAGRVLCIGAGGLGSPALLYLTAAGVGTIGLVDFDAVDVTNLQRQVLYTSDDIGRSKLQAAAARLKALNPALEVELHEQALDASNALDLVARYDVVVDGTDNFPTRYLVNDACVLTGKPNAYGSIFRFEGQASVFAAKDGPCYRCLHPEPPPAGLVPSCAEGGVLGVLPGIIGTIQATEAIKLLTGIGDALIGRFIVYDALKMRFRELKLRRDPDCPICGTHPTIRELTQYANVCEVPLAPAAGEMPAITVSELNDRMQRGEAPLVIDVREPHEHAICRIPGATLIPMGELPQRLGELDRNAEVIIHCRSGGRASRAVKLLKEKGFSRARNLTGGVIAWVDQIDPSQPKY